jgi:hypothetical protein
VRIRDRRDQPDYRILAHRSFVARRLVGSGYRKTQLVG